MESNKTTFSNFRLMSGFTRRPSEKKSEKDYPANETKVERPLSRTRASHSSIRSTTPSKKGSSPGVPVFTVPRSTTPTNRVSSQVVAEEKVSTRLARPSSKRLFVETKELSAETLLSEVRAANDDKDESKMTMTTNAKTATATAAMAEAKSVEDKTTPVVIAIPIAEEKDTSTAVVATPIQSDNSVETFSALFTTLADGKVDGIFDPFHPLSSLHHSNGHEFIQSFEEFGEIFVSCLRSSFALIHNFEETLESWLTIAVTFFPKETQEKLLPHLPSIRKFGWCLEVFCTALLVFIEMFIVVVSLLWDVLKPYRPDIIFKGLTGILICYFGSFFMTTIAAIEALYLCGSYRSLFEHIQVVYAEVRRALKKVETQKESKKTETKTEREAKDVVHESTEIDATVTDSIRKNEKSIDTLTMSEQVELLGTVDPKRLSTAVFEIAKGLFAIVTTLKSSFAKTLTLGNAISTTFETPALTYLEPFFRSQLPSTWQNWSAFLLTYALKIIAISLAWRLRKLLTAVHSAVRGGAFAAHYLLHYLVLFAKLPQSVASNPQKQQSLKYLIGYGLAFSGLYFQFSYQLSTLPFPLNIFLFPFLAIEHLLMWVMNSSTFWMVHTMSG